MSQTGRNLYSLSASCYNRANGCGHLIVNPSQALISQAEQAYASGDFARAISLCDQLLSRMSRNDNLLNLKAMACLFNGQPEAAENTIRRVLKLNPRSAGFQLNAGRIYFHLSRIRSVKHHAQNAIRLAPREAIVLYQAALLHRDCKDHTQALRIVNCCLQLQPDMSEAWRLKGTMLTDIGDLPAAKEALEKAVSLSPGNVRALSNLIKLRRDDLSDVQTVQMLEQARHSAANISDRATVTYALADMHRRENQYESAFELYREANDLVASMNLFDIDAWEQQIANIEKSSCESGGFAPTQGTTGSKLVFIVGMPRSGTTLCEHVLSAHTGVLACGELETMANIESSFTRKSVNPYQLKTMNRKRPKEIEAAATLYLSSLPGEYQKFHKVVDKAPMNFMHIGLIHQIFPAARFVYCTRNPLDTILSCYVQNFFGGLGFAARLDHISRVYITHKRLMQHWSGLLPHLIHTVNYEAMVTDLETEANALSAFLQLDFEAAMLSPHEQKRAVLTASNLQVRKPVYSTSINNWQNYHQQLDEVIQLLESHDIL